MLRAFTTKLTGAINLKNQINMTHYFTLGHRFQDETFAFYGECGNEMTVEEVHLRSRNKIAVVGVGFDLMLNLSLPDRDDVRPTKASIGNQPYIEGVSGGKTYGRYLQEYLVYDDDFVISWEFESPYNLLFIYNEDSNWSVEYENDEVFFGMDGLLHEVVDIANTLDFKQGYEYIKTSINGIKVMAEFLAPLV